MLSLFTLLVYELEQWASKRIKKTHSTKTEVLP